MSALSLSESLPILRDLLESTDEAQRAALLAAVLPGYRIAGPYVRYGFGLARESLVGRLGRVQSLGDAWGWEVFEVAGGTEGWGETETREEAEAALDAALRERGWMLMEE